ncbi:MAG TPA: hypothetical protein VEA36_02695 [Candidatus Paceibacterota bacterium]|nr:hypothetical protein [Candidatus Paceibacterota bacterium]
MFETAPQELLLALKDIYGLSFIPVPFETREELDGALTDAGAPLGPWVDELWEEYTDYDSILAHDGQGNIHRFIWTMTFLVIRERRRDDLPGSDLMSREVLKERIEWPDGRVSERQYANTMSEKLRWRRAGVWIWTFRKWRPEVVRAVKEELGVCLTRSFLGRPWLVRVMPDVHYYKDPETGASGAIVVKEHDPKRPKVQTHNRLFHFILKLHKRFWKAAYREAKRRHDRLVKTMVHTWAPAEDRVRLPARVPP